MRRAIIVSCVVAAISLSSCSSGGETTGSTAGTLAFALKQEPDALDPTLSVSLDSDFVYAQMCDKLYDTNRSLDIVPGLASAMPTVSPDGLTVTIPLRKGVKFQDGSPFNADAVKKTFQRNMTLAGSARAAELSSIKDVEAPDESTIKLTLGAPFSPLTALLADRPGIILSSKQTDKLGANFGKHPVCVGPYKFKDRVAQQSITLVRDSNYYRNNQSTLDEIKFSIVADANVRIANLRAGDVDVIEQVPPNNIKSLESTPGVTLLEGGSTGFQSLRINVGNVSGNTKPFGKVESPLGSDPRVRQAFAMAINREQINKVAYSGKVDPDCFPIPRASKYYPTGLSCPRYDPAAARKLLESTGLPLPIQTSIMSAGTDPAELQTLQLVQSMLNKVGFNVKLDVEEFATSIQKANDGDFAVWLIPYSGKVDPDQNIALFYSTAGASNRQGFHDSEIDALVQQGREAIDVSARKRAYDEIMKRVVVDNTASMIYLYHQKQFLGIGAGVKGVKYGPDGLPDVRSATVGK